MTFGAFRPSMVRHRLYDPYHHGRASPPSSMGFRVRCQNLRLQRLLGKVAVVEAGR